MAVIVSCAWSDAAEEIADADPSVPAERLSPPRFALASAVVVRTSVIAKRKSKESRWPTPDKILSFARAAFSAAKSGCPD